MYSTIRLLRFFLFSGLILSCTFLQAQDHQMRERIKEKVKSQKVAYITEKLQLTEVEAQKFWPIYNSYQQEMEQLRLSMDKKPSDNMSDKEAEDLMYAMLDNRSKEIELQKKQIQKLKTAIPPKKIAMLFRVEREFKDRVITNIRDRHREKGRK